MKFRARRPFARFPWTSSHGLPASRVIVVQVWIGGATGQPTLVAMRRAIPVVSAGYGLPAGLTVGKIEGEVETLRHGPITAIASPESTWASAAGPSARTSGAMPERRDWTYHDEPLGQPGSSRRRRSPLRLPLNLGLDRSSSRYPSMTPVDGRPSLSAAWRLAAAIPRRHRERQRFILRPSCGPARTPARPRGAHSLDIRPPNPRVQIHPIHPPAFSQRNPDEGHGLGPILLRHSRINRPPQWGIIARRSHLFRNRPEGPDVIDRIRVQGSVSGVARQELTVAARALHAAAMWWSAGRKRASYRYIIEAHILPELGESAD